jgi:hypothetical protein
MSAFARSWRGQSSGCRKRRVRIAPEAQATFFRRRHHARRPPHPKIRPGNPAPAIGPGTAAATGAKLVRNMSCPVNPVAVSVKTSVPLGAFPEPKRLKSPQVPSKHVPHPPPGVVCPTSCFVKSNVAPLVDQLNVLLKPPGEKSLNPNVPVPEVAPLTVRDNAVMYLVTGERESAGNAPLGFGRFVRSKVIRALAVAGLVPPDDHSTSNWRVTSAFAGEKRDDALRAITTPMAQTSFDFMTVTPLDGNTASVTKRSNKVNRTAT